MRVQPLLTIHPLINRTQPQGVVIPALSPALTELARSKAQESALFFKDPKPYGKESTRKRMKARGRLGWRGWAQLPGCVEPHLGPLLQRLKRVLLQVVQRKGKIGDRWVGG